MVVPGTSRTLARIQQLPAQQSGEVRVSSFSVRDHINGEMVFIRLVKVTKVRAGTELERRATAAGHD